MFPEVLVRTMTPTSCHCASPLHGRQRPNFIPRIGHFQDTCFLGKLDDLRTFLNDTCTGLVMVTYITAYRLLRSIKALCTSVRHETLPRCVLARAHFVINNSSWTVQLLLDKSAVHSIGSSVNNHKRAHKRFRPQSTTLLLHFSILLCWLTI